METKYTKAKELVYLTLWRISDYLLLISVFRMFEGRIRSKLFPWLHICKAVLDKENSTIQSDRVSTDISSYNPDETSHVDIHLHSGQTTSTVV